MTVWSPAIAEAKSSVTTLPAMETLETETVCEAAVTVNAEAAGFEVVSRFTLKVTRSSSPVTTADETEGPCLARLVTLTVKLATELLVGSRSGFALSGVYASWRVSVGRTQHASASVTVLPEIDTPVTAGAPLPRLNAVLGGVEPVERV